jgi:hypothetical protein
VTREGRPRHQRRRGFRRPHHAGLGLHLIDADLAMGDLVSLVRDEGRAWKSTHP